MQKPAVNLVFALTIGRSIDILQYHQTEQHKYIYDTMDTIKFYIGEENGVVVEKNNFTESIFAEQYKQAIKVIGSMLEVEVHNPMIYP